MVPELDLEQDGEDEALDADDPVIGSFDGEEDAEAEKGMSVGRAELNIGEDDGVVSGFDGIEEGEDESEDTSESSSTSTRSDADISIESAIEDGLAEVACVGLEGREREEVRSEMQSVASKFKVGYFGERCAQKYLKRDIEDIPPEYGLAATLIAFGAFAIYKRPDGDEHIRNAVSIVKEKMNGEPEPPERPPGPPQGRGRVEDVQDVKPPGEQSRAPQPPAQDDEPDDEPTPEPAEGDEDAESEVIGPGAE